MLGLKACATTAQPHIFYFVVIKTENLEYVLQVEGNPMHKYKDKKNPLHARLMSLLIFLVIVLGLRDVMGSFQAVVHHGGKPRQELEGRNRKAGTGRQKPEGSLLTLPHSTTSDHGTHSSQGWTAGTI